ncbi:hypothetical protein PLICRDRAFT_593861 [Plicaturopsis crispa FD-325 SS-3]|nr:hypothetical protein PLICRDRAFT_593861 [Plicaturopsis crispa FD-325 SS-3]
MLVLSHVSFVVSLALSLSSIVSADTHQLSRKGHHGRRGTSLGDGLGACGKNNNPADFIVALNSAQYAGGSHCFEMITITANGKTAQAQIVDECPGCPFAGLDFSEGLFKHFASEDDGVITGSWDFGSGSQPTTTSKPPPPPTTTSHTPTSTWTPPKTTSTTHTTTSSSSSSSSSTSTSTSTTSSTPTPTSSSASSVGLGITVEAAAPAIPTSATDPENLQQFNLAVVNMAAFIGAAAAAQ